MLYVMLFCHQEAWHSIPFRPLSLYFRVMAEFSSQFFILQGLNIRTLLENEICPGVGGVSEVWQCYYLSSCE